MDRSVLYDLFPAEEAAELEMRSLLVSGLNEWLKRCKLTQNQAAEFLGLPEISISEIKNEAISRFSLGLLVRAAHRAGLHPHIELEQAA